MEGPTAEAGRSWLQVVQGTRRFCWESSRATIDDIVVLEERFSRFIAFTADEVNLARSKLKFALVGRFLGRGFPTEYIRKELKLHWGLIGDFSISSLSEDILLFHFQSEKERDRVLGNGP